MHLTMKNARRDAGAGVGATGTLSTSSIPSYPGTQHLPYSDELIYRLRRAISMGRLEGWNLPTRPHKRATTADQRWPHPYACELDAIPPDDLRTLVEQAIQNHLSASELTSLKRIEDAERETLMHFLQEAM